MPIDDALDADLLEDDDEEEYLDEEDFPDRFEGQGVLKAEGGLTEVAVAWQERILEGRWDT